MQTDAGGVGEGSVGQSPGDHSEVVSAASKCFQQEGREEGAQGSVFLKNHNGFKG